MAKTPSKPNVKTSKTTAKAVVRKSAAKTVRASKAPAKKAHAPKTQVSKMKSPKTLAAKKTTPKNVTAKNTGKKSASKPVVKTVMAKKKAPPKAPVTKTLATKKPMAKKSTAKKPAAKTLQAQLDHVTKRLSTADRRTKTNIKKLETEFGSLIQQMGRTKAGQTRLTRRITELSKTLTADLENLQSDIRRELAGVLQNPTITELQTALERADHRLSESESAQDTAIARINRHIADIATIVEHRLGDEARTREAAMADMKAMMGDNKSQLLAAHAALQAKLEQSQAQQSQATQLRFSNLQSESADAIRSLGDKIVDVAEEMGRRREALGDSLRQDINESSLSRTTEFEQFRRVMERRLEALEADVNAFESQMERAVAPLTSRIEGLEYGLTQAPAPQDYAPSLQALPPMESPSAAPLSPLSAPVNQSEPQAHATASLQPAAAQPAANPYQDDAFSPAPAAQQAAIVQPSATAQMGAAQSHDAPLDLTETAAPQAVPYDPALYQRIPTQQVQPAPVQMPAEAAPQLGYEETNPYNAPPAQHHAQPYANPAEASYDAQNYAQTQPPFPHALDQPAIENATLDSDLPYADPAYAENALAQDESMGAARPGAFSHIKKIGRSKLGAKLGSQNSDGGSALSALMTPRNLKLGGLVAALGVASFIGVQTLAKKDAPTNPGEFSVASNAQLDGPAGPEGQILPPREGMLPSMTTADGRPITPPAIDQETIGQYADNRQMALAEGGESALMQAVQAGNPVAQLQLGLTKLESGEIERGVELIRAAANQEQPAALYRLAKLYETGQGVGQDANTARQLTERAARGGNRIAMHDLALYFAEGRGGVEVDMPKAAKWFEKAAERGVVDSQFNLGVLFESGQGLPQDMESALVWYSVAGTQGDQMAAGRVGVLRKTLSEDQVERADTRIAAFTPSRIDEEANGIFKNVPWAKPSQVANNTTARAEVVQTQTLLNELGYAVGEADGAIGPKTKNAILNFQKNNGLSETGTVNSELIERLQIATGA